MKVKLDENLPLQIAVELRARQLLRQDDARYNFLERARRGSSFMN
jgi:hypothetical protein